jgi:hypothetical protein
MKSQLSNTLSNPIIATLLAFAGATYSAQAALLVDGGFELNALTTYTNVITAPGNVGFIGVWGEESATRTGSIDGVTPVGTQMIRTTGAGSAWQTVQITDVSSMSADIDLGTQTFDLQALFTTGFGVSGQTGQVIISFYTAISSMSSATLATNRISSVGNADPLDGDGKTWESIQLTGSVPIGTRYVLSELVFRDDGNAMGSNAGYIDGASLSIVPEPSSVALLGLGATTLMLRRRRQIRG